MKSILSFLFLFFPIALMAQTESELITNIIQTMGGEKNWQEIHSSIVTYTMEGEDFGKATIVKYNSKGKFFRADFQFESRDEKIKNTKYFMLASPLSNKKFMPDSRDTSVLSGAEIEDLKKNPFLFNPFINAESQNTEIVFMDMVEEEGKNYFVFFVNLQNEIQYKYYVDAQTYFIHKSVLYNSEVDEVNIFTDYEKLQEGIWVPKTITTRAGVLKLTNIKINQPFNSKTFIIK
ncbi:MAG: hypothetical protein R2831_08275 [Chitinophagaceae bacterium]